MDQVLFFSTECVVEKCPIQPFSQGAVFPGKVFFLKKEAHTIEDLKGLSLSVPEQFEMLENSVTEVWPNYVLFVSAADPGAVREAFLSAL